MEDKIMDYSIMAKWLSTNELLDYYEGRSNSFDLEKVIKKFAPRTKGEEAVVPCIIEVNNKAIGYIQYYCNDRFAVFKMARLSLLLMSKR